MDHEQHGGAAGGTATWLADPLVLVVLVALAATYLVGWAVVRHRGTAWPWWRPVLWVAGLGAVFAVAGSGYSTRGTTLLSAHMIQHMVLSMGAPLLLLSAAPVTLALRALPGRSGARRLLVKALHARVTHLVLHPGLVSLVFVFSLYGLYFTPLIDVAMTTPGAHYLMLVHFLVVGLLFFGGVLAIDPWPRAGSAASRILLLIVVVPFHAFFGVVVMSAATPLSDFFARRTTGLGLDPLRDQQLAGSLAWALGEVPVVVCVGIVFVQWARSDLRRARTLDRAGDRDGDQAVSEYNQRVFGAAAPGRPGR